MLQTPQALAFPFASPPPSQPDHVLHRLSPTKTKSMLWSSLNMVPEFLRQPGRYFPPRANAANGETENKGVRQEENSKFLTQRTGFDRGVVGITGTTRKATVTISRESGDLPVHWTSPALLCSVEPPEGRSNSTRSSQQPHG